MKSLALPILMSLGLAHGSMINIGALLPANAVMFCRSSDSATAFAVLDNGNGVYSVDVLDFSPIPSGEDLSLLTPAQLKQTYLLLPRPFPVQSLSVRHGKAGFMKMWPSVVTFGVDGLFQATIKIEGTHSGVAESLTVQGERVKADVACAITKAGFSLDKM